MGDALTSTTARELDTRPYDVTAHPFATIESERHGFLALTVYLFLCAHFNLRVHVQAAGLPQCMPTRPKVF
jgi:hypothetical protein